MTIRTTLGNQTNTTIFFGLVDELNGSDAVLGSALDFILDGNGPFFAATDSAYEALAASLGYVGPTTGVAAFLASLMTAQDLFDSLSLVPSDVTLNTIEIAGFADPFETTNAAKLGAVITVNDANSPDAMVVGLPNDPDVSTVYMVSQVLLPAEYSFNDLALTPIPVPTEFDDVLIETVGNDVVDLLGGNDVYNGVDGDDTVSGGAGNDTIIGGSGNDRFRGGTGDDLIFSGGGKDRITGDQGEDTLYGDEGDNKHPYQGFGRFFSLRREDMTGLPTPSRGTTVLPTTQPSTFPEDSTDHETRDDGTLVFTSDAELGVPARYRLDAKSNWRPEVTKTIIFMHFGQSNAGENDDGGGVITGAIRLHSHIVNLNDGYGVRGLMGSLPKYEASALEPFNEAVGPSIQSVVGVSAGIYLEALRDAGESLPQIAVRSEAQAGQAFIGRAGDTDRPGLHRKSEGDHSPCFLNLIASLRRTIELAEQDCAPVQHIYIPFTHQEANAHDGLEKYCSEAIDLFRDVEDHLAAYDIPITWILDQTAGFTAAGGGGYWKARLALHELSRRAPNITYAQPRYPYPMSSKSHWSNVGKVLYGEFLGHTILELEAGIPFHAAELVGHTIHENTIKLTFNNLTPLEFDETNHSVIHSAKGFTLDNNKGVVITDASVTGPQEVTITCNALVPASEKSQLCYAYRRRTAAEREDPIGWAVSTGALRETWSRPCKAFLNKTLHRWVPAFVVPLGDLHQSDHLRGWYVSDEKFAAQFTQRSTDTLVVSFNNLSSVNDPALLRKTWGYGFYRAEGWSHLGVIALEKNWFRDEALFDFMETTGKTLFAKYKNVVLTGTSMGAYAATAFAKLAPNCTVVAFSPQSTLDMKLVPWEKRFGSGRKQDWSGRYRDAPDDCESARDVFIIYDPYFEPDKLHAERYYSDNVTFLKSWYSNHESEQFIRRDDILKSVMQAAMAGVLSGAVYYTMFRARRDLIWHHKGQAEHLIGAGHPKLAQQLSNYLAFNGRPVVAREIALRLD